LWTNQKLNEKFLHKCNWEAVVPLLSLPALSFHFT
jgi:hypothetical protein